MPDETPPPEWVAKFMVTISSNMAGEDPVHCQVWRHDDEEVWHVEVGPSLYEDGGDLYLRNFHVHLTPILKIITDPDVVADTDCMSITGTFEGNRIHLVIRQQPDEPEEDELELGPKKVTETPLPN